VIINLLQQTTHIIALFVPSHIHSLSLVPPSPSLLFHYFAVAMNSGRVGGDAIGCYGAR
jgi:hypothetical protein